MCKEASTFLLNFENNMRVCFGSEEGKPFSIRFADYRTVVTYNYMYKTSSFRVKTKSHIRCKGTDHCERAGANEKGCRLFERHEIFKETDNTTIYGYGCDMSNKYYGSCPIFSYVCTWYQWHVIPEGELYKVYKLNMREFEIDFEYTHGATTHMVTMSDRDMNSNMNLVVADGLVVPMSIPGITGAEHFFSDHIVEIGNNTTMWMPLN